MNKIWAVNKLDNKTAEILLYGYIGSDKVNAADFVAELKQLEANYSTIRLRINSGGGSIFEGIAIFNAIKQSDCNIEAYVDGLAASMASVIVLACKKIYMSKIARLMIHRPSGAAMGNPDQLRSTAEMLEGLESTLCEIYAERTGLTVEAVKAKYMGTSDSWVSADEALSAKLIDGIYDSPKPAAIPPATMSQEQDLVNYFTNTFNMKQFILTAEIMAVLGVTPEANQHAIDAAMATLAAKAANVDNLSTQVTVLQQTIHGLNEVAEGAKATTLVDTAIASNKIVAGDRDKYMRLAKADFETTQSLLEGLKPYMSIADQLRDGDAANADAVELASLVKMSGRELHLSGKFERLKQISLNDFKAKYKDYYGSEYVIK